MDKEAKYRNTISMESNYTTQMIIAFKGLPVPFLT